MIKMNEYVSETNNDKFRELNERSNTDSIKLSKKHKFDKKQNKTINPKGGN